MITDDYMPTRADLLKLADRCDRGAADLEREAAGIIEPITSGGTVVLTVAARVRQKTQAALVARETAAEIRRETEEIMSRTPAERGTYFAHASLVADAANLSGILMDDRRFGQLKAESDSIFDQEERKLWEQGEHPSQIRAAVIESIGKFGYVAGEINGLQQVPFWLLGGPSKPATCTCPCDHDGGCLVCGCLCEAPGACQCCGAA